MLTRRDLFRSTGKAALAASVASVLAAFGRKEPGLHDDWKWIDGYQVTGLDLVEKAEYGWKATPQRHVHIYQRSLVEYEQQLERLDELTGITDLHRGIDRSPNPYWQNNSKQV